MQTQSAELVCPLCQGRTLETQPQDPRGIRLLIECNNPNCTFRELIVKNHAVNRTSSRNGHPSQLTGSEEMSNLVRTSTGPPFNSEPRKRFHSQYFHYDHTSKTSRFPLENGHFSSKI